MERRIFIETGKENVFLIRQNFKSILNNWRSESYKLAKRFFFWPKLQQNHRRPSQKKVQNTKKRSLQHYENFGGLNLCMCGYLVLFKFLFHGLCYYSSKTWFKVKVQLKSVIETKNLPMSLWLKIMDLRLQPTTMIISGYQPEILSWFLNQNNS